MTDGARIARRLSPAIGNCGQCGALIPAVGTAERWWRYCRDCKADFGEPEPPAWVEQLAEEWDVKARMIAERCISRLPKNNYVGPTHAEEHGSIHVDVVLDILDEEL